MAPSPPLRHSPVEGSVVTKAPGAGQRIPGVTSEYFEFDVGGVHDNAGMQGRVIPSLPADIELYLQRRNDDGTWSEFATGTNGGGLDGETIGTNNLTPGHYRLEVHNWAGPAGNPIAIKLTFLNSAGETGELSRARIGHSTGGSLTATRRWVLPPSGLLHVRLMGA